MTPLFFRTAYIGLSYYHGRDYMNIRYDLPVNIVKANLTFRIDGYKPVLRFKRIDPAL